MNASILPLARSASIIFLCLTSLFLLIGPSALAQGSEAVPNGGFEDSSSFGQHWDIAYGKRSLEDSIALKGDHSLKLEELEDHIDLFSEPLGSVNRGAYELSFWYRAYEGSEEWSPLWVEVLQNGEAVEVFRIGKEEARTRKLSRDWLLFNGSFTLSAPSPVRIFIHSDLPELWLEELSLAPDEGI